jgi:hypothetical protein
MENGRLRMDLGATGNERSANSPDTRIPIDLATYMSPNELARRWRVSRSTADRIARDNGFNRFLPGKGRNATVRYLASDVIRFEQSRMIGSAV